MLLKFASYWSDADAVCESVVSSDLLQTLSDCPGPQVAAVDTLIDIGNPYTNSGVRTLGNCVSNCSTITQDRKKC
jgi:hypothetical protein